MGVGILIKCRSALAVAVMAAFGVVGLGTSVANASAPSITTTQLNQTIIDTQSCSFPNTQVFTGTVRTITFSDGTVRQHLTLVGTITANGNTVHDTDHYNVTTTTDGAIKIVGTFIHIVVPGTGLVMIDAGNVAISPSGDLTFTGRQDQLTGNTAAFCADLS
jgi:hypothetical protein